MPPSWRASCELGTLLAAWFLSVSAGAAGERPIVREIVVRGFPGDPAAILGTIQTRQGAPLDPEALNADLGRLLKAGYVAAFRLQSVPDGVRVILEIALHPRIRTLQVTGAGSWDKTLKGELLLRQGDVVPAAILNLPEADRFKGDRERIRAYCLERGYRDARVDSEVTPVPEGNQIDLTFQVALGPKYGVKALTFEGNRGIPASDLRGAMETQRANLFNAGRYYEKTFEKDIQALQDFYRYRGYPDAKVTFRREFRGAEKNRIDITIVVQEGRRYPVASIAFKGLRAFSTTKLLDAIPLKTEGAFSDERLLDSTRMIDRLYKEAGYPYASVRPNRDLVEKGDAYAVTFDVDEGEKIVIRTVRTRGHPRTRREVILRELELEPGSVYDLRKIQRTQRALDRLQFFDNVTLSLVPTEPPMAGERDLLVQVTERHTGTLRFGVGFSTVNQLVGNVEFIQRNFDWRDRAKDWHDIVSGDAYVGAGQYFRVALMPGTIYSSALVEYMNPYWRFHNGRNESFGWSAYYRSRDQGTWLERRLGGSLSWGIRKWTGDPDTNLMWRARLEAVSVSGLHHDAPDDARDARGTHPLFGIGPSIERDRTDNPVLPTSGYKWTVGSELIVPHGLKLDAEGTRFWTLGNYPKGHERVLSVRGGMDYELGRFPIYERLYAGAPYIRGFAYRGVGPHQGDEPIGGQFRALLSAEYRYPLVAHTLYSVFFADAGTVTKNFTFLSSPRLALGVGLRLALPALSRTPLAIDFGIPVLKQHGDETELVYFSVSLER